MLTMSRVDMFSASISPRVLIFSLPVTRRRRRARR